VNLNQRKHARVHAELDGLAKLGILNTDQVLQLKARYPTTAWDFMALVRAFLVLGALAAASGLVILIREHLDWWLVSESALALAGVGFLVLGHWLRFRKSLSVTGEILQLVGSMAAQGLLTVLAIHHIDEGSVPVLMALETLVSVVLAYTVASRLVLWYACINVFCWFGGQTGYVSGWGAYWLGMTYPVRFLAAGAGALLLSWLHVMVVRGRWAIFSRVYAHFGLLVINLALWFLSLFGYYEDLQIRWSGTQGERLLFSLLWAAVAAGSVFAGARRGVRLLRGYGLTFLIINLYTFYFQFVVAHTGEAWFVHLLLTGGSLLWLGLHVERKRREPGSNDRQHVRRDAVEDDIDSVLKLREGSTDDATGQQTRSDPRQAG
jgi:hypothetical protein